MARSKKSVDDALRAALAAFAGSAETEGPCLVAWSGGLDSTVLLHALIRALGPAHVRAVHVQHGLQAAAESWAEHCLALGRQWGVAVEIARIPEPPAPGTNIEQWARRWRYELLAAAAQRCQARAVLTAHHADDQLETLLLALARGCGLDGLTGIAPCDQRGAMRLLRPLLDLERRTLEVYARQAGLSWVHDPSNDALHFRRNRVRAHVLPVLQAALPGLAGQLPDTLALLREARATLDTLATHDCQSARTPDPLGQMGHVLDRRVLAALPAPRQAAALRAWWQGTQQAPPTQARLRVWLEQLLHGRSGAAQQELGAWCVLRYRDTLWRVPRAALSPLTPQIWQPASQPVCVLAGGGQLAVREAEEGFDPQWFAQQTLQVAAAPPSARLRGQADRPRRTLKNLRQEWGIPRALRAGFPALWCQGDLLWAAPFGHDHDPRWPLACPGLRVAWQGEDWRVAWPAPRLSGASSR